MDTSDFNPDAQSAPTDPTTSVATPPKEQSSTPDIMDKARKFLATDEVKNSSREKKIDFLKSKGLTDNNIETLLTEEQQVQENQDASLAQTTATPIPPTTAAAPAPRTTTATPPPPPPQQQPSFPIQQPHNLPPIITYPEFLTKPPSPSPLVTPTRLLTLLTGLASTSITLYGTSKFLINPMVSTLTSARSDLLSLADEKLVALLKRLEGAVSVIPPETTASSGTGDSKKTKTRKIGEDGEEYDSEEEDEDGTESNASDPTECFHRDIGTQTSSSAPHLHPTQSYSASTATASTTQPTALHPLSGSTTGDITPPITKSPSSIQADTLTTLTSSLKAISESLVSQTEDNEQLGQVLDLLRGDLDKMTYPPPSSYTGGPGGMMSGGIGGGVDSGDDGGVGSEDEMKKVREGVRRVKGVLLSARRFPVNATPVSPTPSVTGVR